MDDSDNYVEMQEKTCSELFTLFNDKMKWFIPDKMIRNEIDEIIDYTCIDRLNRKCHVELKQRSATVDKYDTILLDATKLWKWTKIGYSVQEPKDEPRLYFNFMIDGIIIYDIDQQTEYIAFPKKRIWNPAIHSYEYRDKIGLPTENAIIFKYTKDGTMEIVQNKMYNIIQERKKNKTNNK